MAAKRASASVAASVIENDIDLTIHSGQYIEMSRDLIRDAFVKELWDLVKQNVPRLGADAVALEIARFASAVSEGVLDQGMDLARPVLPVAAINEVSKRKRATTRVEHTKVVKAERKRPALPEGLAWPTETFSEANHKRGENIVEFLENVWLPLIEARVAARWVVEEIDYSVIDGINNYTRKNPKTGERKRIPDHLRLLRVGELIDHTLASNPEIVLSDPRLARAALTRAVRLAR